MKAPTFDITLGNETRTLQYAFLAFHEMKLNPFKPQEVFAFLGCEDAGGGKVRLTMENLDAHKAAQWVRAGMLWEYVEDGPRAGQKPPSLDWVMSKLDGPTFLEAFALSQEAAGLNPKDGEGGGDGAADPQTARTGNSSGQ